MQRIALSVAVALVFAAGAHAQPSHLKCYKIKDPQPKVKYTANVNGLTAETGCQIKVPGKLLCVEATKTGVNPPPPGGGANDPAGRFVCYKLKCPKVTLAPLTVSDQFGTRSVQPGTTKYICAPVAPPTTTSTSTTSTTTTATTSSSTTTTLPPGTCCGPFHATTQSTGHCSTTTAQKCLQDADCPGGESCVTDGILAVSTLTPFPFPLGVLTVLDVAPADPFPGCKHDVIVPAGGFLVPVFCIPALGFTSQVQYNGCLSGGATGKGTLWDGAAACADSDVSKVGDTSAPSCGTLGSGCTITGAGADTAGDVDTTRGDTVCDGPGVQMQLDLPATSTTWNDADGNCPDDDFQYDAGTDTLITQFNFILSPSTSSTNARFLDKDGDACSFAGNGPDHVKHCSGNASRPCTNNSHCTTPPAGTCVDGPIVGVPMAGPCCGVGQTNTIVASGIAFTGAAPLYDIIFNSVIPNRVTGCTPWPGPAFCQLPDGCLGSPAGAFIDGGGDPVG